MKTYISRNGIIHKLLEYEGKYYLKCIQAVGCKLEKDITYSDKITCKNCLRVER